MRTTVIISKREDGYISTVSGRFRDGHMASDAGSTPFDAAATAGRLMIHYAQRNPEGGDLMAPLEVMEHVPIHLRNIPVHAD